MVDRHEIRVMPKGLILSEWASVDLLTAGGNPEELRKLLWAASRHTWRFYQGNTTLAIAGVYVSPIPEHLPEIWLLLTREFSRNLRSNLIAAREQVDYITSLYPKVLVRVDAACPNGQRFVEFLGFTKIKEERMSNNRDYIVCEVSNG